MRTLRYTWVNAFTEERFGGNPCMVFVDEHDLDEQTRLTITRESRLSECAFLQPTTGEADFSVRYYLPSGPIPMAGHPTVATVSALIDMGAMKAGDAIRLEVGAGIMPIETTAREGRSPLVSMRQFAPEFGRAYSRSEVAPLYGLEPDDILVAPQTVSTGTPQLMLPLASKDALRRARIEPEAFRIFQGQGDFLGVAHLFVLEGETEAAATFARHPMIPPEPAEDPFTGSATGGMACLLWARGMIEEPEFIAEQGHWMGRPGQAHVKVLGPRENIEGVEVAGAGVVLMRGEIELEDA